MMKLDWRSIGKAMGIGLAIALLGSILFWFVRVPRLEAAFNVLLGAIVGFLFGGISIRHGGDDRFTAMGVGGGLAAILPSMLAWTSSLAFGNAEGLTLHMFQPAGLVVGLLAGGGIGLVFGLIGGLLYASKY